MSVVLWIAQEHRVGPWPGLGHSLIHGGGRVCFRFVEPMPCEGASSSTSRTNDVVTRLSPKPGRWPGGPIKPGTDDAQNCLIYAISASVVVAQRPGGAYT